MACLSSLSQDFIVPTDKSLLHLELSADVQPILLSAGMNVEYPSPESGETEGGDIVAEGDPSASCCRLSPSPGSTP